VSHDLEADARDLQTALAAARWAVDTLVGVEQDRPGWYLFNAQDRLIEALIAVHTIMHRPQPVRITPRPPEPPEPAA
jgi:hypothetical protein